MVSVLVSYQTLHFICCSGTSRHYNSDNGSLWSTLGARGFSCAVSDVGLGSLSEQRKKPLVPRVSLILSPKNMNDQNTQQSILECCVCHGVFTDRSILSLNLSRITLKPKWSITRTHLIVNWRRLFTGRVKRKTTIFLLTDTGSCWPISQEKKPRTKYVFCQYFYKRKFRA